MPVSPVNPYVGTPLFVLTAVCCAVIYFQITKPSQADRDRGTVTWKFHVGRIVVTLLAGVFWPGFLFVVMLYTIPSTRRLIYRYINWEKAHSKGGKS